VCGGRCEFSGKIPNMDVQTAANVTTLQVKCPEFLTDRSRTYIVVVNMSGVADIILHEDSFNGSLIVAGKLQVSSSEVYLMFDRSQPTV
jgi:hypothetical protein